MKGETTNEVRAKVPGGNHCDQDLLDALDEIDAMRAEIDRKNDAMGSMIRELHGLQSRIDAMGEMIESFRVPPGYAVVYIARSEYNERLDAIANAGVKK